MLVIGLIRTQTQIRYFKRDFFYINAKKSSKNGITEITCDLECIGKCCKVERWCCGRDRSDDDDGRQLASFWQRRTRCRSLPSQLRKQLLHSPHSIQTLPLVIFIEWTTWAASSRSELDTVTTEWKPGLSRVTETQSTVNNRSGLSTKHTSLSDAHRHTTRDAADHRSARQA